MHFLLEEQHRLLVGKTVVAHSIHHKKAPTTTTVWLTQGTTANLIQLQTSHTVL